MYARCLISTTYRLAISVNPLVADYSFLPTTTPKNIATETAIRNVCMFKRFFCLIVFLRLVWIWFQLWLPIYRLQRQRFRLKILNYDVG